MQEHVTLYLQEAVVVTLQSLTTASLSTTADGLALPMEYPIMMLRMISSLLIQTQDVKGELQI